MPAFLLLFSRLFLTIACWLLLLLPARAQSTRPILRLDLLTSSMLSDQTHVYFQAGATAGFDGPLDASKLANPTGLNLASFAGTQQLAINGLPPLTPGTPLDVPLYVSVPAYGTYRFQVGQFNNFGGTNVYLRDALLNTRTLLALGTIYSFSMNGTYVTSTRFVLEFAPLPDLVVSTNMLVPTGFYRNVTVTGTGLLQLNQDVHVSGTFTVQDGGVLDTGMGSPTAPDGHVVSGSSFMLEAGGRLIILSRQGITASALQGNIQTTTRSFASNAIYTYNCYYSAADTPVTGDGLPATVRTLGVAVYDVSATPTIPGRLTLSQPVAITRLLDLIGNVHTNGHALTLKSTPTGITALVGRNTGTVVGTLTMERAIDPTLNSGAGYRHFTNPLLGSATQNFTTTTGSTPVSNPAYNTSATPGSLQPFPEMFAYDPTAIATSPALGYSAFDRGWRALANGDAAPGQGRGFIVHLDAGHVARFQGTLNHTNQTLPLPARFSNDDGWSLLGNPFASLLDWRKVPVPAGLENAFYVFETTGAYAGRYRSYVNGMGASPLIPTGQAFFVRTQPGTVPVSLTVPDSARTVLFDATVPTFHRGTVDSRPQVKLSLSGQGSTDEVIVYSEAGATAAFDSHYDAYKLPSAGQIELATLAGPEALSIDGRLLSVTQSHSIPLRVTVPQPGNYIFTAPTLANLTGLNVYLLDTQAGQRVNLQQQPTYAFTAATTALAGRFVLQIGAAQATAVTSAAWAAAVQLYPNPAHEAAMVTLPALPNPSSSFVKAELLDGLGRVVWQREVATTAAGTSFRLPASQLAPGLYTLRLMAGELTIVKRLAVQ